MSCCGHSHSVDPSSGVTSDVNILEVGGSPFAQGQRAIADSLSVVLATGHGSVSVTQGTSPWVVSLASTTITGTVAVTQSTSPWVVSGTVTATPTGTQDVNLLQIGGVAFAQGQRAIASSLSITLATSHPAIAVSQSGTWVLGANSGVDIGDVTINNASGASAVNIQDGGNSITVDGTVSVGNFPATQPVSGTVTANQGTSPWVVSLTSTTITGTVAVTQSTSPWVVSGAVDTELPAAAALADDTANPTVPAVGSFTMVFDGTNWDRAPGTTADGLLVNLGSNNDVTVTGSVTANAGTNLNTSSLNLEATQADVRTALQIIDDWDESDRAKVNPIAGQAGVQGGSGGVTALTQRTTLATDVALPTGTNSLGKVVPEASSSGAALQVSRNAALSNTAVAISAISGRLYGWHVFNPGTALAYVQVYNLAAASVVVGTTTPTITLALPSNSTSNVGVDGLFSIPVEFSSAISMAATTTPTGGTAPGTALLANMFYRNV